MIEIHISIEGATYHLSQSRKRVVPGLSTLDVHGAQGLLRRMLEAAEKEALSFKPKEPT